MKTNRSNLGEKGGQQAFTFKELLAILFILGILGTVAFASMSGARDRTTIVQCESNLRQFTLAVLVYGGENNDRLPSNPGSWAWDLPWAEGNLLNGYGAPWQVM